METQRSTVYERMMALAEGVDEFLGDVVGAIKETDAAGGTRDGRFLALKLGVALVHTMSMFGLAVGELAMRRDGEGDDGDDGEPAEPAELAEEFREEPLPRRVELLRELAFGVRNDLDDAPKPAHPVEADNLTHARRHAVDIITTAEHLLERLGAR